MRGDVAKVRGAPHGHEGRRHRRAVGGVQALAHHHDARALLVDEALRVVEEGALVEGALGQVDEVGAAGAGLVGKAARGGDPAGVSAHGLHDDDVDGQAAHVAADGRGGGSHVARRAREAGRVVGHRDVVVHGLGDAHDVDGHALLVAGAPDLAAGVHRAVAAGAQKPPDALTVERVGELAVVLVLERLAARADGRGGREGQQVELVARHLAKVDEVAVGDAAHAAARAEDAPHAGRVEGLVHGAVERGVDHGGGAAAVYDEQAVCRHG